MTLGGHIETQTRNLCAGVGLDAEEPVRLLGDVLGAAGARALSEPPLWSSDVADDGAPVEYSVQFDDDGGRRLRILAETLPEHPGPAANLRAAQDLVDSLASRYDLALDRLRAVQDLFSCAEPQDWAWWFSLIFTADGGPQIKIYLNPNMRGAASAPQLVAEAFDRLDMPDAYATVRNALRRGGLDRLSFVALDLDQSSQARVKVYFSQHDARPTDAEAVASAVPGIEVGQVRAFCSVLAGDVAVFRGRPLVSSYSWVSGDGPEPSNYSCYLPVRDYVRDDAVARDRVRRLFRQRGLDPAVLDKVITAVTDRPLSAHAGLLAHVSLRLSHYKTGTTVYLSSEAHGGTPLRDVDAVGHRTGWTSPRPVGRAVIGQE
ncbi:tryptophan dimethylallyltransferase [Saccharopolyspora sp. K220]|uniref:tryptophan dimethylallyltransferase family protein n=1 Tax=Saccharopolyspora soli TaxID=2926618 RepID=UPI001F5AA0D5|nr:tryptophan dimethylallyltransferase family protein [Saccharopolyspora soli]MCI2421070.1 tryptophan dimethylallyltransferase [Saccharopolyspora soli]